MLQYGSLQNSYSTASVSGSATSSAVGGLVGYNINATISNSHASGAVSGKSNIGGFVGYNATNGVISNSYSTGTVTGGSDGSSVGGFVGGNIVNTAIISNSYSTGAVSGGSNVGGFIGSNSSSTVSNSYSTGAVSGGSSVGGFVGSSNSATISISNSYSTGTATGTTYVGGFVGKNGGGTITNSYSTGTATGTTDVGGFVGQNAGTITNSFWDTETSGQARGIGTDTGTATTLVGKTTNEMQTLSTFTNAGWTMTQDTSLGVIYPKLVNGAWVIGQTPSSGGALSYTLSTISSGYTYNGTATLLSSLWSSSSIFGASYSSWVAGTDYNFVYNANTVTGFTNAGAYTPISVAILKSGYSVASSGNTNGSFTITPANLTVTSNEFVSSSSATPTIASQSGCVGGTCISSVNLSGSALSLTFDNSQLASNYNTTLLIPATTNTDLNVNRDLSWSGFNLTLQSDKNININQVLTASGATDKVTLNYGQGAVASGNTSSYGFGLTSTLNANTNNNFTGQINLQAGNNFATTLGSNGAVTNYTVITSLGTQADATTAPATMTLQGMAATTSLAGNYVLGANIDASSTSGWNSAAGFTPIGTIATKYSGKFNGLGHSVSGVTINRTSESAAPQGLFGATSDTIQNIGLVGGSVSGYESVGGLVGYAEGGLISNSYTTQTVSGNNMVGGLVGASSATISNSIRYWKY